MKNKRIDRLLRPLNKLDRRDVIELEERSCNECDDELCDDNDDDEMNYELRKISDRNGFINYYNGRYFVDLISNVSDYIDDFIAHIRTEDQI